VSAAGVDPGGRSGRLDEVKIDVAIKAIQQ
jgi:hypothetical protein